MELPAALIAQYMTNRETDLALLRESLVEKNFEQFAATGHRLKGSGPAYGFPELGQLGGEMLQAGRSGDLAAITEHMKSFEAWLIKQSAAKP